MLPTSAVEQAQALFDASIHVPEDAKLVPPIDGMQQTILQRYSFALPVGQIAEAFVVWELMNALPKVTLATKAPPSLTTVLSGEPGSLTLVRRNTVLVQREINISIEPQPSEIDMARCVFGRLEVKSTTMSTTSGHVPGLLVGGTFGSTVATYNATTTQSIISQAYDTVTTNIMSGLVAVQANDILRETEAVRTSDLRTDTTTSQTGLVNHVSAKDAKTTTFVRTSQLYGAVSIASPLSQRMIWVSDCYNLDVMTYSSGATQAFTGAEVKLNPNGSNDIRIPQFYNRCPKMRIVASQYAGTVPGSVTAIFYHHYLTDARQTEASSWNAASNISVRVVVSEYVYNDPQLVPPTLYGQVGAGLGDPICDRVWGSSNSCFASETAITSTQQRWIGTAVELRFTAGITLTRLSMELEFDYESDNAVRMIKWESVDTTAGTMFIEGNFVCEVQPGHSVAKYVKQNTAVHCGVAAYELFSQRWEGGTDGKRLPKIWERDTRAVHGSKKRFSSDN